MNKELYERVKNLSINELSDLISEINSKITDDSNTLITLAQMRKERISEIEVAAVIAECANPGCDNQFVKNKRQKFCSDACKQNNYRLKKDNK